MPIVGDGDFPTYYANLVSVSANANEVTMEFRTYIPSHKEMWERGGKVIPTSPITPAPQAPPPTADEVYNLKPTVRVVMTIPSAQWIVQYLNVNLPVVLAQRQGQVKGN